MMEKALYQVNFDKILGRKPENIDFTEVTQLHHQKCILVTGGAGSIGGELVRQICSFSPKKIVVFDQGETQLHELNLELKDSFPSVDIDYILGDVSDKVSLKHLFENYQFDIVYHAAAYKHVPIIEKNPREGVRVNILGTKNVAEFSSHHKVRKFVMISTDKAVNPISVMGMTKRIAELFIQYLHHQSQNKTKFITTRFGNVLGSNGSVFHRFIEQIKENKPLTITHPEVNRYFMTISESCRLVLQSMAIGKGGEICVFDMGEPIKIVDLAKKIGEACNEKIEVSFTELRAGDKMSEELFNAYEHIEFTRNNIIFSKNIDLDYNRIGEKIEKLSTVFISGGKIDWKVYLKEFLAEF